MMWLWAISQAQEQILLNILLWVTKSGVPGSTGKECCHSTFLVLWQTILTLYNVHVLTAYNSFPQYLHGLPPSFLPSEEEVKSLSRVQLFATPWTVAYKAPVCMEFSRQEYWSGLPFPSPGDLPHSGIKPRSPTLQADALPSEPPGKPTSFRTLLKYHLLENFSDYSI